MPHNDERVKVQIDQELYDDLTGAVHNFFDENVGLKTENEYLRDFIDES